MMKIRALTICGSLRARSSNGALLDAFEVLASERILSRRLEGVGELPLFNPDCEPEVPDLVREIRAEAVEADVLVFSTPEYIHALPAALKNLLEWLVGDPGIYQKPVVILHASPVARLALESLHEVLSTMSARILESASAVVPLDGNRVTKEGILRNPEWTRALKASASEIVRHLEAER